MSNTRRFTVRFSLMLFVILALLVFVGLVVTTQAKTYDITVNSTSDGVTEKQIGACEAHSGFSVTEITGAGLNLYRIWGSSAQTEPVDDDGTYGSPSIASIKSDPSIIPWSVWNTRFTTTTFRNHGVSLYDQLEALRDNDITPVVTLCNYNNKDAPEWMAQMNPPNSTDDWNEWWEHVFAMVYYVNVREGLGVHDWQVHNEPDNDSQGWGGTLSEYLTFTQYTADAIQYVYDTYLTETFRLYAPVSTHANEWIENSLDVNDDIIDVVDWHRYGPPESDAETINGWIDTYDSDGISETLMLSEWGDYRGGYDSMGSALNYGKALFEHSDDVDGYVAASSIFSLYSWNSTATGLILEDGTKTISYYMFRLMTRGLQGGKTRYTLTHDIPDNLTLYPIAAVDEASDTMYVTIVNKSHQIQTINLDVSAHATSGTVTYREVSDDYSDEQTGTGSLSSGEISFDVPSSAILQVIIPLP